MKMTIKDLELKMMVEYNRDGWAMFVYKSGRSFKHRGGWTTPNGITWSEVVHVLDPYEKGVLPNHTTFLKKKVVCEDADRTIYYIYVEL